MTMSLCGDQAHGTSLSSLHTRNQYASNMLVEAARTATSLNTGLSRDS